MAAPARRMLLTTATALAVALTLAGCATRYDANGDRIYFIQFGQDTDRAIDYSNPRLPILPPARTNESLWPIPSPYQFNDLSKYSFLAPQPDLGAGNASVGDNVRCAASCDSNARLALVAARADARDGSRATAIR